MRKRAEATPVPASDSDTKRLRGFPDILLTWYADKKRDLPWRRGSGDPYPVWVSEMMLQQTTVATVIPFWTRWMERFPTIAALAEADLDDVLHQWQGLGYYARARNMHRAARQIRDEHGGVFPRDFDSVLALPGIGRYTAGAVCSIALGLDVPIVDANVIRVLCRVFGVHGDPKSGPVQERLWSLAETLIPPGRASDFNQAMMELGALVCQAKPRCPACPARDLCAAYASGMPDALPEFAPRPEFTRHTDVSAIIGRPQDDRLLLARRFEGGLWGGLYEFPRVTAVEGEAAAETARRAARETVGLEVDPGPIVGQVRHGVTTHKITLLGVSCTAPAGELPQTVGCAAWAWVTLAELDRYALSSPQKRLAAQIAARREQPALEI